NDIRSADRRSAGVVLPVPSRRIPAATTHGKSTHAMTLRSDIASYRIHATLRSSAFCAIVLGAMAATSAQASVKVVRTPEGDVTVLTATSGTQQKVPSSAAAHPFA